MILNQIIQHQIQHSNLTENEAILKHVAFLFNKGHAKTKSSAHLHEPDTQCIDIFHFSESIPPIPGIF